MLTAGRIEDLRDIAKALGGARRLVGRAMQSDVRDALYSSWCETNACFKPDPDGLEPSVRIKVFDPVRTNEEFDKGLEDLAALETAASHAAKSTPTKRGRP